MAVLESLFPPLTQARPQVVRKDFPTSGVAETKVRRRVVARVLLLPRQHIESYSGPENRLGSVRLAVKGSSKSLTSNFVNLTANLYNAALGHTFLVDYISTSSTLAH